jgi:hypothetical protein
MRDKPFLIDQATGHFPFRACRADRRFSYGVYVPSNYTPATARSFRILVAVHGSERAPEATRARFVDLAEELGLIVLAPLFPVAVTDDEETHNYLFLAYRDTRYDLILLAMVDEVAHRFDVPAAKVSMAGFSGGGQFAHRFMYLHARRLDAVSVGAPGAVNTLDEGRDWFVGVRDVVGRFGLPVDRIGLQGLPVQVVVGSDDVAGDVIFERASPLYMDGVNDGGATRVERAGSLHRLLVDAGVPSRLEVVPGAAHEAAHVQLAVEAFFREAARRREPAAATLDRRFA